MLLSTSLFARPTRLFMALTRTFTILTHMNAQRAFSRCLRTVYPPYSWTIRNPREPRVSASTSLFTTTELLTAPTHIDALKRPFTFPTNRLCYPLSYAVLCRTDIPPSCLLEWLLILVFNDLASQYDRHSIPLVQSRLFFVQPGSIRSDLTLLF